MAETVTGLATRVRGLLDTSSGRLPDATLLPWLNEGARELYAVLVSKYEDYFVKEPAPSISVAANTESYAIAGDDLLKLRGVDFLVEATTPAIYRPLKRMPLSERNDHPSQGPTVTWTAGEPTFYFLHGKKIFLRPIPTVAKTNGLRVWYIPQWPAWTAIDSTALDTMIEQYAASIVSYCCWRGTRRDERDESNQHRADQLGMLRDIQTTAKSRDAGGPRSVSMVRFGGRRFPRR